MSERILIPAGRRQGRTLANEAAMRRAIAEGKQVFTGGPTLNGVWFAVTLDGDDIRYTALTARPEGV